MPKHIRANIGNLRLIFAVYRGVTLPERLAEYMVKSLNFISREGRYPRLEDMANQMDISVSAVQGIERNLLKRGFLNGQRRKKNLKLLGHMIMGRRAAELLLILASIDGFEVSRRFRIKELRDIAKMAKKRSGLEFKPHELKELLKTLLIKGYLRRIEDRVLLDHKRWVKEKIIVKYLYSLGREYYRIPQAMTFTNGAAPMRKKGFTSTSTEEKIETLIKSWAERIGSSNLGEFGRIKEAVARKLIISFLDELLK